MSRLSCFYYFNYYGSSWYDCGGKLLLKGPFFYALAVICLQRLELKSKKSVRQYVIIAKYCKLVNSFEDENDSSCVGLEMMGDSIKLNFFSE